MPSAKASNRTSFTKNRALILFFTLLFGVIALRSEVFAAFSIRGSLVASAIFMLVAFAVNRLKKTPQLVEWFLFLSRPLVLVLCFPCSAALMLAVTLALLKGLVAYFFGLSNLEGTGRQRLLFDLGLLPLSRRNKLRYFDDIWFSLSIGVSAMVAFMIPATVNGVATLLWCVLAGFVAIDLLPNCETHVGDS